MAQRSFKLSDELDARLVAEAERQGRSVSNLIVRVLDEVGNKHSDPGPSLKRFDGPSPNTHRGGGLFEGTPVDLGEKIKELEPAEGVGNPVGSNIVGRRTAATAQYDKVLKGRPDTAALKRKLDANPGPLLSPLPEGTPLPKIAPRRQPR